MELKTLKLGSTTALFDTTEKHKTLYLYSDFTQLAWAKDPDMFRVMTGSKSRSIIRCCWSNVDELPEGYEPTAEAGKRNASDPIKRKDTRTANQRFIASFGR